MGPQRLLQLLQLASATAAASAAFEQGAWWSRLPLKDSLDAPSSNGKTLAPALEPFRASVCAAPT